jgi:hypothetical protein
MFVRKGFSNVINLSPFIMKPSQIFTSLTNFEFAPLLDLEKDATVEVHHEHGGEVKVKNGRGDLEGDVGRELGLADVRRVASHAAVLDVVPADNGHDPEARDEPHQSDHDEGALLGALPQVAQWRRDGPVAVHTQDEQVEDGRRAGRVVGRKPKLTHRQPQHPVPCKQTLTKSVWDSSLLF